MSSSAQEEQRIEIAVRAESILSQFWRDDDTHDGLRALEIEGWVDVLEGCAPSEIRAAWASYQRSGPRSASGRLAKPDAGALWRIVIAARPKPKPIPTPPAPPAPDRPRISAERAQEIMAEVFGGPDAPGGAATGALGALARSLAAGYAPDQGGAL